VKDCGIACQKDAQGKFIKTAVKGRKINV